MNTVEVKYNEVKAGDKINLGKDGVQTAIQINLWGNKTPLSCHEVLFTNAFIYVGWGNRMLKKVLD
jgi:hypothetical protein